ncbi:MAG: hypothetical protein AAF899_04230 [Pseudomonadota bacterium]
MIAPTGADGTTDRYAPARCVCGRHGNRARCRRREGFGPVTVVRNQRQTRLGRLSLGHA